MKIFFQHLREQSITKWALVILCICCFIIARGELTAQANARVSFDEYPPAIIYTPVRSDQELSASDSSSQEFETFDCSCNQKERLTNNEHVSETNGLAWGAISKILPK